MVFESAMADLGDGLGCGYSDKGKGGKRCVRVHQVVMDDGGKEGETLGEANVGGGAPLYTSTKDTSPRFDDQARSENGGIWWPGLEEWLVGYRAHGQDPFHDDDDPG